MKIKSIKSRLLCFTLSLLVLLSATGFKTKDQSKLDGTLLKDDFYAAVNKEWLSTAKIKEGEVGTQPADVLVESITNFKKDIFKDLVKKKNSLKKDSTDRKMLSFYEIYLDTKSRNKDGIKPIENYLNQIKSVKTTSDLNKLITEDKFNIFSGLYNFSVSADIKNTSKSILYVAPTTLILGKTDIIGSLDIYGNSDEYTNPSEQIKLTKNEHIKYYTKVLKLSGYTDEEAKSKIENKFKFEEMIAPYIMGQKERTTNPDYLNSIYNVCSINDLNKLAPNLDLPAIMKSQGYDKAEKIILHEPKWLSNLNSIYVDKNISLIKDYIELNIIAYSAPYLTEDFKKAIQERNSVLLGIQGNSPIEEDALSAVEAVFGNAIGKLYVEKHFTPENKKDVENLVEKFIASYKNILSTTDVFEKETRTNAIKKLDSLKYEIGYPDKWQDYSNIEINDYSEGGSLYENMLNATYSLKLQTNESLNNSPLSLWTIIPPHMIEAFYSPTANSIYLPAGILQPPFYDRNSSLEEKLGSIGAIIGHEISHAFDTTGAKFDEIGNLRNWWTKKDLEKFTQRADKVRAYYSKIEYLPGHFINGDLKVGENIADIGSVQSSLNILKDIPNANYKEFFESWAKTWCGVFTPEVELYLLQTMPHSPHKIRGNVALQQFEKFHETYNTKPGDKMYVVPWERLKIW